MPEGYSLKRLSIRLYGPLEIRAADGADVTPQGSRKILGLVALLATAPRLERERGMIEDTLWSDRSAEQRSASLRQALSSLRRSLGQSGMALTADRHRIGLDPALIEILPPNPADNGIFLEGLVVPDPVFEAWLRLERGMRLRQSGSDPRPSAATPGASVGEMPALYILREPRSSAQETMLGNLFVDALSRSLAEHFSLQINYIMPRRQEAGRARDLTFTADAMILGGTTALRVALEAGPMRRPLWSGHRMAVELGAMAALENDDIQRLVNEAVEGYADALLADQRAGHVRLNATAIGRLAVRRIFTMRPTEYEDADDLLNRAFDLDPRGIYLAWKVLMRIIQLVERHQIDRFVVIDEAIDLAHRAVELEPMNSMVLAAASNAAMLVESNAGAALELAQRSVRLNQSNPFAWDCLSTAALHAGKLEEAYVFAVKAQRLAGNTPFKHWYDMGRSLMATVTGRLDEALRLASAASVVPHFKPPLRYIAALYADKGLTDQASLAVAQLRRIEPDFAPGQMVEDPDYPVAALRRSQILKRGMFGDMS